jgi:hypothetical protein
MRMLAAIPLALSVLAGGSAATVPQDGEIRLAVPAHCDPIRNVLRTDAPGRAEARRLDRLPAGNLDLAVMRRIDNCPEPVTIRQGIGATAAQPATKVQRTPVQPRARLLGR